MNRPTLTLSPGVKPRTEKSKAKPEVLPESKPEINDTPAWQEHRATKPSKRKTTLFLRRRIRDEKRNNHSMNHRKDSQPKVPVEKVSKRSPQDRLHKGTFVESLSEDSLEAILALKNDLAKSTANAK